MTSAPPPHNPEEKQRLARLGDTSEGAIAERLRAALKVARLTQKDVARMLERPVQTINAQFKKGRPSIELMRLFYRGYRIDFNFLINGDFAQLPSDVQNELIEVLDELERYGRRKASSD
ncbi:XRE family transcriptional regulator [Pseudooceanicola nanhaiensis]|uniref:XRE family transcriptional regulator n=1 Tax=Pseudooceanicola nanhaiensis TaxID=375761 RepID=UPI00351322CD